jgi:hypothetical protein
MLDWYFAFACLIGWLGMALWHADSASILAAGTH